MLNDTAAFSIECNVEVTLHLEITLLSFVPYENPPSLPYMIELQPLSNQRGQETDGNEREGGREAAGRVINRDMDGTPSGRISSNYTRPDYP